MTKSTYFIDEYVSVKPGEAFRLLPFGKIIKNGQIREITKELASKFKLPHFLPPIKRGSHAEEAPAGGHITALEVRDDGLYAIPEYNEQGIQALENGDYRYHSPEIIWDGWLENPKTGEKIEGPLIVGDALLHTPHLGEATALYTVVQGDETMTTNGDMVSVSTLDKIFGWFQASQPEVEPEPEPVQEPQEDYGAKVEAYEAELEQYKAQVAEFEAKQERQARIDNYAAELEEVEVDADWPELLADLEDDVAGEIVQKVKAMAEQARVANLTEDVGAGGADEQGDATAVFDAAIKKVMNDEGVSYPKAMEVVRVQQPEVFTAYVEGR